MKQSDLKKDLQAIIKKQNESLNNLKDNDNPQIVALYREVSARLDFAQAILDRINGNKTALTTYK